ncbi:MAG: hypothetical protein KDA85_02235 [Planctomycetaceae bacterium]|nr:hypothetical protein [Planctomycetaceae bacterium]
MPSAAETISPSRASQQVATSDPGALRSHPHDEIVVPSRPVIERLPVNVVEPVDVCVSSSGQIFVADRRQQAVFRIDPDGEVHLALAGIEQLKRVSCDRAGRIYVLAGQAGDQRLLEITQAGYVATFGSYGFEVVGVQLQDPDGVILAARDGRIYQQLRGGEPELLANVAEPIRDICAATSGATVVLTESGKCQLVARGNLVRQLATVPAASDRLFVLPSGQLAALVAPLDSRPMIVESVTSSEGNSQDTTKPFAQLPQGTAAVAFDRLGNLCLANPELRAVTRVTNHFEVPCPHCSKLIPMRFSTEPPQPAAQSSGSF